MKHWLAGRILAGAVLALLAAPALAQEPLPENAPDLPASQMPQPGWSVTCRSSQRSSEAACSMSQVLATKETRQRVLAATVLRDQRDGKAIMRLSLPHGLMLPKGVKVAVDGGQAKSFPILTADKNGSYAIIVLEGELASELQSGKIIVVSVERFAGGEVDFRLTLEGFGEGFAKL